jgi:hypothetical protein
MIFMFFVSNGQEVKITKNKYKLVEVNKSEDKVDLLFTPVVYLMKDVDLYDENKLSLSKNEYSRLLAELYLSINNKVDKVLKMGENSINIDYENTFYVYSRSKLGRKLLKNEQQVRFSINGKDCSVYLTKEGIEKMMT